MTDWARSNGTFTRAGLNFQYACIEFVYYRIPIISIFYKGERRKFSVVMEFWMVYTLKVCPSAEGL